jgi:hypothetical protein
MYKNTRCFKLSLDNERVRNIPIMNHTLQQLEILKTQKVIAENTRQTIMRMLKTGEITLIDIMTNKYLYCALYN